MIDVGQLSAPSVHYFQLVTLKGKINLLCKTPIIRSTWINLLNSTIQQLLSSYGEGYERLSSSSSFSFSFPLMKERKRERLRGRKDKREMMALQLEIPYEKKRQSHVFRVCLFFLSS